jgi:glycosyltransferase involved in cell wall biosynthesis
MKEPLRVAINAQVGSDVGGRGQFVRSLIRGLAEINSDGMEYVIVTEPNRTDWPRSLVGSNMEIVPRPWHGLIERFKSALRPMIPYIKPLVKPFLSSGDQEFQVPDATVFFHSLDVDLVHFPYREWMQTDLPMIYNLGDLQHLHYPEFFDETAMERRNVFCPAGCQKAESIITSSDFVKRDIQAQYGIDPEKIQTIRRSAPTEFFERESLSGASVRDSYNLPTEFVLYPSKKWPHKNHIGLLEALGRIRDRYGESVNLVCTGKNEPRDHFNEIIACVDNLNLEDQVQFLGYVSDAELVSLYQETAFVVFPTLFEGQGFLLVEAFDQEVPIACSSIPPLKEYADDAAVFFDPKSTKEMADRIYELATDYDRRAEYRRRSVERSDAFSWSLTAESYQAVYRKIGGVELSDREQALLAGKGMLS